MIILLLLLLATGTLAAQDNIPWGQEFRVNSFTINRQSNASVSHLKDGGFVVCWVSRGQDGSRDGVYAQRYDSDGNPAGKEFRINMYAKNDQGHPCVCGLAGGGFIVCWSSPRNGLDYRIYARLYGATGQPLCDEFQANRSTDGYEGEPTVCGFSNGDYMVCWMSVGGTRPGIFGQRFGATGERIGDEFCIGSDGQVFLERPIIAGLSDGGFVVSWEASIRGSVERDIIAQRFEPDGQPAGDPFRVNGDMKGDNAEVSLTGLSENGFVIAWASRSENFSRYDVRAQCYDREGQTVGSEFSLPGSIQLFQGYPNIISLPAGRFVASWVSLDQDGSGTGVYARLFDSDAKPLSHEFRVNTCTVSNQQLPNMSSLPDGGFVVCWESYAQDGSHYNIMGKRFPGEPLKHHLRPFELIEPQYDATVTLTRPTLIWQPASDKTVAYPWEIEYTVYYDTLADFSATLKKNVGQDTTVQVECLAGKTWFWKVLAKTYYGDSLWSDVNAFLVSHTATGVTDNFVSTSQFVTTKNYPNPFNPSTEIQFELPREGFVAIRIYDLVGRLVGTLVNEQMLAGFHSVQWHGLNKAGHKVAAGVYLYRIEFTDTAGDRMAVTKKMSLVK